jgi:hypothetical protein
MGAKMAAAAVAAPPSPPPEAALTLPVLLAGGMDVTRYLLEYLSPPEQRRLLNTSRRLADMKKHLLCWKLTKDQSRIIYARPSFRSQLETLIYDPSQQLRLRLGVSYPAVFVRVLMISTSIVLVDGIVAFYGGRMGNLKEQCANKPTLNTAKMSQVEIPKLVHNQLPATKTGNFAILHTFPAVLVVIMVVGRRRQVLFILLLRYMPAAAAAAATAAASIRRRHDEGLLTLREQLRRRRRRLLLAPSSRTITIAITTTTIAATVAALGVGVAAAAHRCMSRGAGSLVSSRRRR